ncbi:Dihydrofolate reductase [Serinicoccus hydrothermalis]|uniref:Dihydrofolate reductase n=1 Tax=Serinicoccus hydrothermalis TaxID=1758689 RepID=A0A1B1NGP8_9MICO|nr:Dihydrofolate reductase [Serinicoccus hydrothermalis]
MGRVVVVNFVSIDGVVQSPLSADEDRDGGFEHGGWVPPLQRRHGRRRHAGRHGRRGGDAARATVLRHPDAGVVVGGRLRPGRGGDERDAEVCRLLLVGRPHLVELAGARRRAVARRDRAEGAHRG